MSDKAITTSNIIESVVIGGDLAKLSPDQRVAYYKAVCDSMGINPLTRPFDYITLNGRLTLYANKGATDQLRQIKNISIDKPEIQFQDEWIVVTVSGSDMSGRKDSDVGVVNKKDMRGDFGNALMKAVTKAKRRLTLSICGLGMLDETEVETIPTAKPVKVNVDTGEVIDYPKTPEKLTRAQAMEDLGYEVKKPEPTNGNPPPEVQKALDRVGGDKKRYGDLTDEEMDAKVEKLTQALERVTEGKKQDAILNALDDVKLVKDWWTKHPRQSAQTNLPVGG